VAIDDFVGSSYCYLYVYYLRSGKASAAQPSMAAVRQGLAMASAAMRPG